MNQQEQSTSTNRRPTRQNGWLKMTLATGGIALTMLGTGLLARSEAVAVNTPVNTVETGVMNGAGTAVEPLPTLVVPNPTQSTMTIPDDESDTSGNQLVMPSTTNQTMPQFSARSRSSR